MKNLIYFLLIITIVFGLSACETDILTKVPNSNIDLEEFYSSQSDAEIGLIGCYSRVISIGMNSNILFSTISADELTAGTSAQSGIGSGDFRGNTTSAMWGAAKWYSEPIVGVANLNLLLERVSEMSDEKFTAGRKNEILGEAYFLRGWTFYMMAMVYSDIPIVTSFPTTPDVEANIVPSNSQEEVLDQAMSDLQKSIDYLYDIDNLANMSEHDIRGRGSKWAAMAFKARIHLWRNEWSDAFRLADSIINKGSFVLTSKWTDIFSSDVGGNNDNEEVIWQSQGQSRAEYDFIGLYRWFCDNANRHQDENNMNALPPFMVEKKAVNMFESGYKDVRLEYSVYAKDAKAASGNYGGRNVKHFHVPSGQILEGISDESRDKNMPLCRLAEIYMIKAEAIVQSNYSLGSKETVLELINALRARAADPTYVPRDAFEKVADDFAGCAGIDPLTVDMVDMQAVKDEKFRELLFEGIRWFDLIRWSRDEDNYEFVKSVCGAQNRDQLYTPLHQEQINVSRGVLKQLPGWGF